MIAFIRYLITSDVSHFVATLTSVGMVLLIGLILLALFHRQEGRNLFWRLAKV